MIASASGAACPGGTSRPVTPSTTASGMPPAVVATTGRDAAIASRIDVPSPSVSELITNTSRPPSSDRMSGRKPTSFTLCSRPRLLIWRCSAGRSSPSPKIRICVSGRARTMAGAASTR